MDTRHYSTSQMDDFYVALASGTAKLSGVMNYIQHLFVAERCSQVKRPAILDACCGRGLLIPLLKQYSPCAALYVGVDICLDNLRCVKELALRGDHCPPSFPVALINGDITEACHFINRTFDVVVYTSALEHLTQDAAVTSIQSVAHLLDPLGTLFLSTPNTPRTDPPSVQYKVHVYEWHRSDLLEVLNECGLTVTEEIGLIHPTTARSTMPLGEDSGTTASGGLMS